MNIAIIGTGYVGLVSGVCFANQGHTITCVDVDTQKIQHINKGISPIYEEGLETLLQKHKDQIHATTSYDEAIQQSDITFICVGTPSKKNGEIDLTYIDQATKEIARCIRDKKRWHAVIVKSTVVPGTTRDIILPLLEEETGCTAGKDFGVGMNPEFLKEGVAIQDFLNPDRIVNGYYDDRTQQLLKELYKGFTCPLIETSVTTAEMIKYASNCYLATKISFMNEIGNFCKHLGIDAYDVAEGMGTDKRIGRAFLNSGIGWGGSCFPKDTQALRAWAHKENQSASIIDSTIHTNDTQPLKAITLLKKHFPTLNGKTIGILGLAFKPDTDDIRDSRSLVIIKELLKEKADIKTYDPKAMPHVKNIYPNITYCNTAEEVLDSEAVIIATLWDEFNSLSYQGKTVIDGRRIQKAQQEATIYEGVCW